MSFKGCGMRGPWCGTTSGFTYHGCRRDACKSAASDLWRGKRERWTSSHTRKAPTMSQIIEGAW